MNTKSVLFFSDDITIVPHSATNPGNLGKPISIKAFCKGKPMRLFEVLDSKEYIFELLDRTFVQGPEEKLK